MSDLHEISDSSGSGSRSEFVVGAEADASSRRLDQLLSMRTGISRHAARRLIEEGAVKVDGRTARKPGLFLVSGQRISLSAPAQDPRHTPPVPQPELPLEVFYEDAALLVVNKPAGWNSHPLRPGETGSLASSLVARYPECVAANPEAREGGLCQRLDRYTSGVLVAARTAAAWAAVREHFGAGRVQKEYLALVVGVPEEASFDVSAPVLPAPGPDRHRRLITATLPEQIYDREALDAHTRFFVLSRGKRYSLLRAETSTGRRHQVRAHLCHLGFPLFGDTLYGAPPLPDDLAPLFAGYFLHASRIRFPGVPGGSRELYDVSAPLPAGRAQLLQSQGLLVPARP